jgi:hypothetical protein
VADGYGLGTVQVGSASISAWTRALGRERHRHRNKPRPRPHAIRHGPSATAKNERFDGFFHPAFGHPAAAGQPRHLPGFGRTSNPSDITSHCIRSEGQGLPSRNAAFRVTARSPQNVRSCDSYPFFSHPAGLAAACILFLKEVVPFSNLSRASNDAGGKSQIGGNAIKLVLIPTT